MVRYADGVRTLHAARPAKCDRGALAIRIAPTKGTRSHPLQLALDGRTTRKATPDHLAEEHSGIKRENSATWPRREQPDGRKPPPHRATTLDPPPGRILPPWQPATSPPAGRENLGVSSWRRERRLVAQVAPLAQSFVDPEFGKRLWLSKQVFKTHPPSPS